MRELLPIFITVFLAELGDKTQLAAVLFASDKRATPVLIFLAAAAALVASTALAVALGSAAERWLQAVPLKLIAGAGFVAIGLWTLSDHFRS